MWNPLINYVVGAGFEELKLVKKLQQFTCGVIAERRRNIVDVRMMGRDLRGEDKVEVKIALRKGAVGVGRGGALDGVS